MKEKKVFVSGSFDLLHAGHIAFLKTAAQYGKLYVAVGADSNIFLLKGVAPYFSQKERLFMVSSVRFVEEAFIASGAGKGMIDFEEDLERIKPDIFVVNYDGHTASKEALCKKHGIDYIVLERLPEEGYPARASSHIKKELQFPYRLCISGGWMDQPWISEIFPGSVIVAQLWPTINFNYRSGMATSSRNIALELWGNKLPNGDPLHNAKLLFGAENPPGSKYISGSQDHIGLLSPGINRLYYNGGYWPDKIDSVIEKEMCDWLSSVLYLIPLKPRHQNYNPIAKKNLSIEFIKTLSNAGEKCWQSILSKDVTGLGESMTQTLYAWKKILPDTVPDEIITDIETNYLSKYSGVITSGSGGGYLIVASDSEVQDAIKVKIRY